MNQVTSKKKRKRKFKLFVELQKGTMNKFIKINKKMNKKIQ